MVSLSLAPHALTITINAAEGSQRAGYVGAAEVAGPCSNWVVADHQGGSRAVRSCSSSSMERPGMPVVTRMALGRLAQSLSTNG